MEVQATKNCNHLNFEERFGFGDLENAHNHCFSQIERIR